MSEDGKSDGRRRQKCKAKAKGTGQQCQRWARDGYDVCMMHGAGTRVRQEEAPADGRVRQDPATAGLKAGLRTGRYLTRTKTRFGEALADFHGQEEELFDLKLIAARLWTALMTLDEVEGAFDLTQLVEMPEGVQLCTCGELYRRSDVARDILNRVFGIRSILHELIEVVRARHKLDEKTAGTITETQMVAIIVMLVTKLHEIVQDPKVPRDQIPKRLTAWIEASAKGPAGAASPT